MKDRSLRFVLFLSGYAGVPAIIKEVRSPGRTLSVETIQSFILHPLFFILLKR